LFHRHRGFRDANRGFHREAKAQTVAILHRGAAGEAQARFLARAFARQFGCGIGGGLVRVVAAFLSLEARPDIVGARALRFVLESEIFQISRWSKLF
jgi:hypothetical protein